MEDCKGMTVYVDHEALCSSCKANVNPELIIAVPPVRIVLARVAADVCDTCKGRMVDVMWFGERG